MLDWRMSLWRTKSAIISWAGSLCFCPRTLYSFSMQSFNKMSCDMTKPTKWLCSLDQPGHPPSLIRVFAVRMKKAWALSYPLSEQRRLWLDWANAQADLESSMGAHSFCWFCHEAAQMTMRMAVMILSIQTHWHTCHISQRGIKSHKIWPIWKPIPIFYKPHRIFRTSCNKF